MDIKHALQKINTWSKIMWYLGIALAVITFFLLFPAGAGHYIAVIRFWTSFALTIFFGVFSITIKKIYQFLILIDFTK